MPDCPAKASQTQVIHFLCEKKDPQAEPDFAFVKKLPAKTNALPDTAPIPANPFSSIYLLCQTAYMDGHFHVRSRQELRLLGPAACKVNQKTALQAGFYKTHFLPYFFVLFLGPAGKVTSKPDHQYNTDSRGDNPALLQPRFPSGKNHLTRSGLLP